MRRVLAIVLIVGAVLALLMVGIRLLGGNKLLPSAVVLMPSDCALPCWHGILPSRETIEMAHDKLLADNDFMQQASALTLENDIRGKRFCGDLQTDEEKWGICVENTASMGASIRSIRFIPDKPMTLGHALMLFGEPVAARICTRPDDSQSVEVYFENYVIVRAGGQIYDPNQVNVWTIEYISPSTFPAPSSELPRWRGFQTPIAAPSCY